MIQSDFVGEDDRTALTVPAREGRLPCQTTRRANASVLLDDGWSARQVAHALLLDEATLRGFRKLFERGGSAGLESFEVGGNASDPAAKQEDNAMARAGAARARVRHAKSAPLSRGNSASSMNARDRSGARFLARQSPQEPGKLSQLG